MNMTRTIRYQPDINNYRLPSSAEHTVKNIIHIIRPLYGTTRNPDNRNDWDMVSRTVPTTPDWAFSILSIVKTLKPVSCFSQGSGL
jgi:hypothetical protein